jgi:hypothetical protein
MIRNMTFVRTFVCRSSVLPNIALFADALSSSFALRSLRENTNVRVHRDPCREPVRPFPSRVDRRDLLKVFQTLWQTLLRFEAQDGFQCYVSHLHVKFAGRSVLFSNLEQELKNSL